MTNQAVQGKTSIGGDPIKCHLWGCWPTHSNLSLFHTHTHTASHTNTHTASLSLSLIHTQTHSAALALAALPHYCKESSDTLSAWWCNQTPTTSEPLPSATLSKWLVAGALAHGKSTVMYKEEISMCVCISVCVCVHCSLFISADAPWELTPWPCQWSSHALSIEPQDTGDVTDVCGPVLPYSAQ